MIPRPPRSTLFPYTTLFDLSRPSSGILRETARHAESFQTLAGTCLQEAKDRKSTRLNSSHVASSYAVFCLKKKNATFRCISRITVVCYLPDHNSVVLLLQTL